MVPDLTLNDLPDPTWPVVVLAGIQLVDGMLCIGPVDFIRRCFQDVNFPQRWWWLAPIVKFAATAGLVTGLVVPGLAAATTLALVAYFVVAIAMHIRARDFGRNLFINATGMLLICITVFYVSFTA
jgi:hypothetical protein